MHENLQKAGLLLKLSINVFHMYLLVVMAW